MSKSVDRETWLRSTSSNLKNQLLDQLPEFDEELFSEAYITFYQLLYHMYHGTKNGLQLGYMIVRPVAYNQESALMLATYDRNLNDKPVYINGDRVLPSLEVLPDSMLLKDFLDSKVGFWHENWYYDLIAEKLCVTPKTMQAIETKNILIKDDNNIDEADLETLIYTHCMIFDEKLNQHSKHVK